MKTVFQSMRHSAAGATTMTSPDSDRARSRERKLLFAGENLFTSTTEGYRFTYLILDFLEKGEPGGDNQTLIGPTGSANGRFQPRPKQLMLYITDPSGQRVRNAQAILSLINPQGHQQMARLDPWGGGYCCNFKLSGFGIYRIETELITDCQMLTDAFFLGVDGPSTPY